jgi:signal transduction histidine kinase
MSLYYSIVVTLKAEFELEAHRSRTASEELERARALAEENMKARIGFFSKMSHELRTPLNAIIGYSEILMEELDDEVGGGSTRAKDVRGINSAGKHLLSLVANVLDSDRIEDETLVVQPVNISVRQLCDAVVANARPMIEKNGNSLQVHCPQPERMLHTDGRKVRQIAINLLGNAAKFTSNGVVRLEMVIESGSHDDYLRMSVKDTGIGIPEDARDRLFGEYQQADPSVRSRFGGTGIGLALSRQLCSLLGGQVSFVSRTGHGTTFTVTLPTHYLADVESTPREPDSIAAQLERGAVISA